MALKSMSKADTQEWMCMSVLLKTAQDAWVGKQAGKLQISKAAVIRNLIRAEMERNNGR